MTEDLVQWTQVKGLEKSKLDKLLVLRQSIKEQEEAIGESLAKVNAQILNALATADVKSVGVGDTRVTLVPGGQSEKLDKKKLWTRLLELGMPEKKVARAFKDSTKSEPKEAYVLVTPPKKEKVA